MVKDFNRYLLKHFIILFIICVLVSHGLIAQDYRIINVDEKAIVAEKLLDIFTIEKIIKLETSQEGLIDYVYQLEMDGNNIYIFNYKGCFVFSHTGQFIGSVYSIGRGPGELVFPTGFSKAIENSSLSFYDNLRKVIYVYSDISARRKLISPRISFVDELCCIDSGKYLLRSYLPQHNAKKGENKSYSIYEFNPYTKSVVGILDLPKNYNSMSISYHTTFSRYNDNYYVKLSLDNSIYWYNKSNMMKPKYKIDFGKRNIPEEWITKDNFNARNLMYRIQKGNYCSLVDFQELDDYFLIIYDLWPERYTQLISKADNSQIKHAYRSDTDPFCNATPFFEYDGMLIASLQPSGFLKIYNSIDHSSFSDEEKNIYNKIADDLGMSDNPVLLFLKPR